MTRARHRPLLVLLAGAVLLGGCVYYNGMYNTNRLAKAARKAERDGRPFEANNYWGQVVPRAESLAVRHPRSRYADEANVLRGLALSRLGECPSAVAPLARLSLIDRTDDLTEEAALALGRCQLELGDAALADLAFERIIESRDSARRHEARFQHARALRMTGRYEEALLLLRESPDPRGGKDLLLALSGAGRSEEAFTVADSVLAANDTSFAWDSVIVALGRQDPQAASHLVGRLQGDPRLTPELRAQRLYQDALRLADVDTARSASRLEEAARIPGITESAERARLRLVRRALSGTQRLDELAPLDDSLAAMAKRPTGSAAEAGLLGATVAHVRELSDSTAPGVANGDLRLFLGAETVRDTLRAPVLAAGLFRRLAVDWPGSPYAPKALLAAEQLDPTDADATLARLDSLYPGSPYVAIARGEDAPAYRALEDSLEAFAAAQPVIRLRPQAPGVRRRVEPAEGDQPRRRDDAPAQVPVPRRHLEP